MGKAKKKPAQTGNSERIPGLFPRVIIGIVVCI